MSELNYRAMSYPELRERDRRGDREALRERLIRDYQTQLNLVLDGTLPSRVAVQLGIDPNPYENVPTVILCTAGLNASLAGDDMERWDIYLHGVVE